MSEGNKARGDLQEKVRQYLLYSPSLTLTVPLFKMFENPSTRVSAKGGGDSADRSQPAVRSHGTEINGADEVGAS
jgi:hypothetical protein